VAAIWIGIDDTDSPRGGCTTWTLTELVDEARTCDLDLIGEPRLVRLNPNIPWKTRGNAALAARFGIGFGPRRRLGEVAGRPVWSFARGRPVPSARRDAWVDRAWRRVLRSSRAGEMGTDPALVATERPPGAELYWNAVREVVEPRTVLERLSEGGAVVRTDGDPRGVVGASAAIAWPGRRCTWELLAYRSADRCGTPREVDADSVRTAQQRHPDLFLCHDPRTRRLLVAPHTACPILFGLRGRRPEAPLAARRSIRSETVDRWLLFRTNQGTGDHLVPRPAAELSVYRSGIVTGTVVGTPRVLAGGHVGFDVVDRAGTPLACIAFEPTKTLPRVAQGLRDGDAVRVWGGRGERPSLRLEGLEVLRLGRAPGGDRPPSCPACGGRARSLGRGRGFRCRHCHGRWPPEAALPAIARRPIGRGEYHPTPSARRHLAPLGPESGPRGPSREPF
jgi:tRNA(Ile2)-agmatinylcytidine synthase